MSSREVKSTKSTPITTTNVYSREKNTGVAEKQKGLITWVTRLEERVFGQKQAGNLIDRIKKLEDKVKKPSSPAGVKLKDRVVALSEALSGPGPARASTDSSKMPIEEMLKKAEDQLGLKPDPGDDFDQRIKSAEKVLGAEAVGGLYDRTKNLYEEIFGAG